VNWTELAEDRANGGHWYEKYSAFTFSVCNKHESQKAFIFCLDLFNQNYTHDYGLQSYYVEQQEQTSTCPQLKFNYFVS
jgi:hypothetical protein